MNLTQIDVYPTMLFYCLSFNLSVDYMHTYVLLILIVVSENNVTFLNTTSWGTRNSSDHHDTPTESMLYN